MSPMCHMNGILECSVSWYQTREFHTAKTTLVLGTVFVRTPWNNFQLGR